MPKDFYLGEIMNLEDQSIPKTLDEAVLTISRYDLLRKDDGRKS